MSKILEILKKGQSLSFEESKILFSDLMEGKYNESKIIEILETLLFKGHTHVKRARGITLLPRWIAENKVVDFYAELNDLI